MEEERDFEAEQKADLIRKFNKFKRSVAIKKIATEKDGIDYQWSYKNINGFASDRNGYRWITEDEAKDLEVTRNKDGYAKVKQEDFHVNTNDKNWPEPKITRIEKFYFNEGFNSIEGAIYSFLKENKMWRP